LLGKNYTTVFVTAVSGNQLTLSVNTTQTRTTTSIGYYLPISDTTWSNPQNSAYSNYGGTRVMIQYATDATVNGSGIDTMFDTRNNITYWTTGLQGVYNRTRYKRSNNIYSPIGSVRFASTLGGTLRTGEKIITTSIFRDTSAPYPENWDLHLVDTSYGITNALPTPGFTVDFEGGLIIDKPSIGLYAQYRVVSIDTCTFTYGSWSTCSNGIQTRPYTFSPTGCIGTPPMDSIRRTCTNSVIISFYYNTSRKAIWINTTIPGTMRVTNTLGNVVRNVNYIAGGQWISMNRYPSGVYFASTFGQNITFIR
jgi:hypothetical protein